VKVGDLVKMAHYGTLARKEDFEEYVMNKWGLGLVTQVFPADEVRLDQYGSEVDWEQVEVLWSKMNTVRIDDAEAIEVIN
jgi:hypothetical protein